MTLSVRSVGMMPSVRRCWHDAVGTTVGMIGMTLSVRSVGMMPSVRRRQFDTVSTTPSVRRQRYDAVRTTLQHDAVDTTTPRPHPPPRLPPASDEFLDAPQLDVREREEGDGEPDQRHLVLPQVPAGRVPDALVQQVAVTGRAATRRETASDRDGPRRTASSRERRGTDARDSIRVSFNTSLVPFNKSCSIQHEFHSIRRVAFDSIRGLFDSIRVLFDSIRRVSFDSIRTSLVRFNKSFVQFNISFVRFNMSFFDSI